MNPANKQILKLFLRGLVVALLLTLAFDAVDYRAHGPGWHCVQAAGFVVERNNVWWNLLK